MSTTNIIEFVKAIAETPMAGEDDGAGKPLKCLGFGVIEEDWATNIQGARKLLKQCGIEFTKPKRIE